MIYDYAFVGAGAAGLLVLRTLLDDPYFEEKRILVLEKESKDSNDRTWCFWEPGPGAQDEFLDKTWSQIEIGSLKQRIQSPIAPYTYKMVRSKGFYEGIARKLAQASQVDQFREEVLELQEEEDQVILKCTAQEFRARQVFDSRFDYTTLLDQKQYPVLQQHFLGWFVQFEEDLFDPNQATFMDFQIPQKGNTRFMYVLPISKREALLEYTLFSAEPLKKEEYEAGIEEYLKDKLKVEKYQVVEKESGNIPMTCYPLWEKATKRIIPIGTAGGWAKASTGYTFKKSERKALSLAAFLKTGKPLNRFASLDRFWFYDLLLLDILWRKNELGAGIFGRLFERRPPQLIFKFLDEQTSFWEEIQVMSSSNAWIFLGALRRNLYRTVHQVFSKSS